MKSTEPFQTNKPIYTHMTIRKQSYKNPKYEMRLT